MRYKLTSLLFFVPFMLSSGWGRLDEGNWFALVGVLEIALGVGIAVGSANEIKEGRRRRRTEDRT
ncbi:hypothetical protein [Streptomyces sp. CRN 30]|uniref:hypothetical protein n=1 Tax=Streptomyces sp. CRN 30 TaxID=3075613 RepID=UPI002A829E55|nr:hypothetical protein [Streptomyces sp. CRN 30]